MRLLVVEDNRNLVGNLFEYFEARGHEMDAAPDGIVGLHLAVTQHYDAIILDWMLPRLDGRALLQRLREHAIDTPVIMLTARDELPDKIAGFRAGADDYLTKPFHLEELLARLRALIRRASGQASAVLQCGDWSLDTRSGRVTCAGQPVTLTAHEYKVLDYLMHRPGVLVSRAELTEHIYAQDFDRDSNTIEVFVGRLRKKMLPPAASSAALTDSARIETVRGMGYRLVPP